MRDVVAIIVVGVVAIVALTVKADVLWLIAAIIGVAVLVDAFNNSNTPRNGH